MKTFTKHPNFKPALMEQLAWHRSQDRIARVGYGKIGDDFRGCAIGCAINSLRLAGFCTLSSDDHAGLAEEIGVPESLLRLADHLFENLPSAESLEWPHRFFNAIPEGVDLSLVVNKWLYWLLVDPVEGVLCLAKTEKTKAAIHRVAELHLLTLRGGEVTNEEWALEARAAWAAREAGEAGEARAAWASSKQAAKLIELLAEAK